MKEDCRRTSKMRMRIEEGKVGEGDQRRGIHEGKAKRREIHLHQMKHRQRSVILRKVNAE